MATHLQTELDTRPSRGPDRTGSGELVPFASHVGNPPGRGDSAQSQLEERLQFEMLLSDFSARFINLSADQVDSQIEAALRHMGEFLHLDRSTVGQISDDGAALVITHCWSAPGFGPWQQKLTPESFPWGFPKLLRGEAIVFARIDDLPEEAAREKAALRQVGPRSNVTIPLSVGGGPVFGAVGFGIMSEDRAWPDTLIQRLGLASQILANALERKRAEQKLQVALTEIQQLKNRLQEENLSLRQEVRLLQDRESIVGQSRALQEVLSKVKQVARTDATVLLLGETGTGKELLAKAIHNLSSRSGRTMVRVNCAALPAALVESELFGREKGAYTGALSGQIGRFELAHESTIFLDEVGDLPADVQVKLLRVLQEGQLEHLGSPKPIHVNVRVVAATNRNLVQLVREGRFREDLYYRLNVFPITVPPLRERLEDIPLLVWSIVEEFARAQGKSIRAVAKDDMEALQRYPWPGNVRELRNIIERAVITCSGSTLRIALPEASDSVSAKSMVMEHVERDHLLSVLDLTSWRIRGKNGAAELLQLKPTTLESRISKLGIRRPSKSSNIS